MIDDGEITFDSNLNHNQEINADNNHNNNNNTNNYNDFNNGNGANEETEFLVKPLANSNTLSNPNSKSHLYYIDTLIEQFKFSKYHIGTLFVCMFSMFLGGYATSHYIFNKTLFIKQYSWTNTQFSLIFVVQNLFCAAGAFISVTSTTLEWDINSNSIVARCSFCALLLLHFFTEAPSYVFLTIVFYFCHGFINNICCNFLLEEFKLKQREAAFLFASSFRLIGCGAFGLVAFIGFDLYNMTDPIVTLAGLTLFQFILCISLMFFNDSPRLLFCNNQLDQLYDYIEIAASSKVSQYRKKIMTNLLISKQQCDNEIGSQHYENIFYNFTELWKGRHLNISLKSIVFVFLSTFLMSNIKDCYSFFISDSNKAKDLFIIADKSKPHYKIVIYYFAIFLLVMLMTLLKQLTNVSRRILAVGCLVFCFMWLILLFVFIEHFIYFLGLFEAFASFYFMMVYLYFSTYTTTKLRNSMTSLMFLTMSASMIFQCVLLVLFVDYSIFSYINCIIILVLIVLDFVLIHDDTKDLKLQQIEVTILQKDNININININTESSGNGNNDHDHKTD